MSRITALLVGIAALTVISTVADAADGCGRGWYYNGRRCVPQEKNPAQSLTKEQQKACLPSNPSLQAWRKTILPSASMWSLSRMPSPDRARMLASVALPTNG
jgi:hypothetical protein